MRVKKRFYRLKAIVVVSLLHFYFFVKEGKVPPLSPPSAPKPITTVFLEEGKSNRSYCGGKQLFVYDIPSSFTEDLLSENKFELVPGTKYAQWQSEYYLHQSLKVHPCTTSDPENAKTFFIPLYGSGMRDAGVKYRFDVKDALFTWLRTQKSNSGVSYFDRNLGRDHAISMGASRSWCKPNKPQQRTSKCLGFSQQELFDSNLIKLSVEYTGLRREHFLRPEFKERLSRIIIVPYLHFDVKSAFGHTFFQNDPVQHAYPIDERKILLGFSGSLLPKTAPFRAIFKDFCDLSKDCVFQSKGKSRQVLNTGEATSLYSVSKFCAILGGDTRASKRLFDALDSLCIPVIFDPLLALPFAADIPYDKITISADFIRNREDVRDIIDKLKQISESEIRAKQKSILKYKSFLSYFHVKETNAVDMIVTRILKFGKSSQGNTTEKTIRDRYSDWMMIHKKVCSNPYSRKCKLNKFQSQALV